MAAELAAANLLRRGGQVGGAGGGAVADLAIVFFTRHHVANSIELARAVREVLSPRALIGVSAMGVVAGAVEVEQSPGVAVLAGSMPGVSFRGFTADDLMSMYDTTDGLDRLGTAIGARADLRALVLLSDPTTVPMIRLLPTLGDAAGDNVPIVGGMASSGSRPGSNALVLGGSDVIGTGGVGSIGLGVGSAAGVRVVRAGLVGLSISGNVRVDGVVSQGCRPFGPTMVVTKAKGNLVMELSGRSAVDQIRGLVSEFGERAEAMLRGGLFMGRVINEYKDRFGRDDFLIRPLVGVEPENGAVAVGDILRVGTTVRMHVRDAATARQDLAMLLDGQSVHDAPAGAMLVTCTGRGKKLFGEPHHDARALSRLFTPGVSGESRARAGTPVGPVAPAPPVAGFFAAGEIGPVGARSYLHGHTACAVLFRARD